MQSLDQDGLTGIRFVLAFTESTKIQVQQQIELLYSFEITADSSMHRRECEMDAVFGVEQSDQVEVSNYGRAKLV